METRALDPRLRLLADLVPPAAVVADIGCDHGLLTCTLLRERPQLRVIAADISRAAVAKTRTALAAAGFGPKRSEVRWGDGLSVLAPREADVIVIAGLGGRTMARILQDGARQILTAAHVVLGPHTHTGEVRRVLAELGLGIETERFVEVRGHFYVLLRGAPGNARQETDPFWYEVGRVLPGSRDADACRYGAHLRRKTQQALEAVGDADAARAAQLRAYLRRLGQELQAGSLSDAPEAEAEGRVPPT